ncbi:MAG: hypothetical protein WBD28_04985 [Candidatus Zixiibacteriota bacterium]
MERIVEENTALYRYWGIEIRIVFVLIAIIIFLLAIFSFFSNPARGLFFLVITIIVVLGIRLDYNYHLLSLDDKGITSKKLKLGKGRSLILDWKDVKKITTKRQGFFDLCNKTQITSIEGQTISASSFIEDYFHFLKDIVRLAQYADIDKLTKDLIAGRADF